MYAFVNESAIYRLKQLVLKYSLALIVHELLGCEYFPDQRGTRRSKKRTRSLFNQSFQST